MVSLVIKGVKESLRFINRKNKQVEKILRDATAKAAIHVQGEVKLSIAGHKAEPRSVDTGRFLNSVGVSTGKNQAKVFSKVPYAKKLEFGTDRFRGRRHFDNSAKRNKKAVSRIMQREIARGINQG